MEHSKPELSESVNRQFFRPSWSRFGTAIARMFALPLFLIVSTGWLPNKYLDLPPKGPWPWAAIIGVSLIFLSLAGFLFPVVTLRTQITTEQNDN